MSGYLGSFLTADLSRDITLYYQLRISLGRALEAEGLPILSARTWPGSPDDDEQDFWRGLLPDTAYARIFKQGEEPDLLRDRVPAQAQPHHIGAATEVATRTAYTESLAKQRKCMEHLMKFYASIFTPAKVAKVRALLDLLASNLDPYNPVQFHWPQEERESVYGRGRYLGVRGQNMEASPNLYGSARSVDEDAAAAELDLPDGMVDPEAFRAAVDRGEVDLLNVENCFACKLQAGTFYLLRPDDESKAALRLLCVKRVIPDTEHPGRQWGAWAQEWELSCSQDPSACYITDPWHAHARHRDGQRYKENKSLREQTWTYDMVPLSEFQDRGACACCCACVHSCVRSERVHVCVRS